MFINYSVNQGVTIDIKYITTIEISNQDIGGVLSDALDDRGGSCILSCSKFTLIEEAFWQAFYATPGIFKELYTLTSLI